jgi:hypothetical protein
LETKQTRHTSDCNPSIVERLARHLEDIASEPWPFIQEKNAVVRQRHVARARHLSPTDHPPSPDGVVAAQKGRVEGRGSSGETGDAMNADSVDGFGRGHVGEGRRQASGQHRSPGAGGARSRPLRRWLMVDDARLLRWAAWSHASIASAVVCARS